MIFKNVTYKEQEAWVELLGSSAILMYFISKLQSLPGAFEDYPSEIGGLFLTMIVLSIVIAIVGHIVFSILRGCGEDRSDERDQMIYMRSVKLGYHIMSLGIVYLLAYVVINAQMAVPSFVYPLSWFSNIPTVDFLLHGIITLCCLTAIAINAMQIFYYRRGF